MIIDTFQNRLKKAMEFNNMKQVDLVEKTKLDKSLINKYLAGISKAGQKKLTILANALNVNEVWLMGYDVPMEKNIIKENNVTDMIDAVPIMVLGKISAGAPLYAEENQEGYSPVPSSIIKKGHDYFYLRINGDSMNLKFDDGSLVLIERQDTLENGQIGAIRVNGYDATIKQYRYENGLVMLDPMSTNPIHKTQVYDPNKVEINIIGKAIWYQGPVLY